MEHKDIKSGVSVNCNRLGITNGRILGLIEGSHTKVKIVDKDRGEGFDTKTQTYKGVRRGGGWSRGENLGYEQEHVIHRKELELKK